MRITNIVSFLIALVAVFGSTWLYWFIYGYPAIGIDDANIYMVYMKNFAEGHGFVYNVGGERVEGFTSILWTLVGGIVFKLFGEPERILFYVSTGIVVYTIWEVLLFLNQLVNEKNKIISVEAIFILACIILIPGYFIWTIFTLMETGLWSCLLTIISINLCRWELLPEQRIKLDIKLSILLMLLVLTRPESYLWGVIFLGLRFLQNLVVKKDFISSIKSILTPAIGFFTALSGLILWRLWYFGYPFPNTYYAKVSSDWEDNLRAGKNYVDNFFIEYNPFMLYILLFSIAAILFSYFSKPAPAKKKVMFLLFVISLVSLFFPLYAGGDHFNYGRFLQPVVIIYYLLFISSLVVLEHHFFSKYFHYFKMIGLASLLIGVYFLPATNLQMLYEGNNLKIKHEFRIAENGRDRGNILNEFFAPYQDLPSWGVITAGGTAFAYQGETHDLLGLNDVKMAHASKNKNPKRLKNHASFNEKVFYKNKTDILLVSIRQDDQLSDYKDPHFFYQVLNGILGNKLFLKRYSPVLISSIKSDKHVVCYASKNFLRLLESTDVYSYKVLKKI